ncbi:MAG: hypothetical protein ABI575_09960, partial [Oxalobacteraceae bacterium]
MALFGSFSTGARGARGAIRGFSGEIDMIKYPIHYSQLALERYAMAGHSKWANIKHKKAATDAKRG